MKIPNGGMSFRVCKDVRNNENTQWRDEFRGSGHG